MGVVVEVSWLLLAVRQLWCVLAQR